MLRKRAFWGTMGIAVAMLLAGSMDVATAQRQRERPTSRRSERVKMQQVQVASPDGKIKFTILPDAERLTYTVTMGDTTVVEPSPLKMDLDGYDLSSGVDFEKAETYEGNDTYPWNGAHSMATDHYNGVRISLEHDLSYTKYVLDVRVFDDGVAYRHVIPGQDTESRTPDEYSEFVLPKGSTVWYGGIEGGHYETEYVKKDISDVQPGEWAGPPLTYKLPSNAGYASITEADLVNYSGMALEADGRRGWIIGLGNRQPLNWPFELRYGRDEAKRLGLPASVTGTISTPWRVVMVGPDLNTLVNSTIVDDLCPPPDPKYFPEAARTNWVKPGRAVWRYLDGGQQTLEGTKEFSKLAGELGFKYQIVEGYWRRWSMEERKEATDYSRQQGVGLFFWMHSRDLHTPDSREEFFKMLHDVGATGAKIDFFDDEAKEVVDLYTDLLKKAAEYHILLVFHGADKPTGLARTWPNEMVREAVRGMESSALKDRALHETTLPFTRLLAGPADYTGVLFNERRRDTSIAHQIAVMAVYASPLLTIAENPQNLLNSPAVDVIKSVPPVWDETIVLPQSGIGEMAAYARRTGDTWFLAVMNGPEAKAIKVPLSFLGTGNYEAAIVSDKGMDDISVDKAKQKKGDTITLKLAAGGGYLARFTKAR